MKVTELMIGDWVHVDGVQVDDDGKNPVYQLLARRVEGLRKGVVEIDHYEFPPCLCMPILLTRERYWSVTAFATRTKTAVLPKTTFLSGMMCMVIA